MKGGRIILIRRFVPYRMYTFVSERRGIAGYVAERRFQKRQKTCSIHIITHFKNWSNYFLSLLKPKNLSQSVKIERG